MSKDGAGGRTRQSRAGPRELHSIFPCLSLGQFLRNYSLIPLFFSRFLVLLLSGEIRPTPLCSYASPSPRGTYTNSGVASSFLSLSPCSSLAPLPHSPLHLLLLILFLSVEIRSRHLCSYTSPSPIGTCTNYISLALPRFFVCLSLSLLFSSALASGPHRLASSSFALFPSTRLFISPSSSLSSPSHPLISHLSQLPSNVLSPPPPFPTTFPRCP